MVLYDVIIIGSGPAGTFSAYPLKTKKVLMLDVGYSSSETSELQGNLYDLRAKVPDLFDSLIGKDFESLHNLFNDKISYKLKAPYMAYILKNWQQLSPVKSTGYETMMSFAKGGLANGWGAGVYQFNDQDLQNFPITEAELLPFYDELTAHIGISGENDDLEPSFGYSRNLLPPLKRSLFFENFLASYKKNKTTKALNNIKIGTPRLAILSQDYNGRSSYKYDHLDFFRPLNPAVYNPLFTLRDLEKESFLTYLSGYLVVTYKEMKDHVEITAKKLADNTLHIFKSKKLILAAGALNTAKLILKANEDTESRLPLLDNPMVCIPIVDFRKIGSHFDRYESPIAQLNLIYEGDSSIGPIQASLYGSSGPLRTDISADFPLSLSGNMAMTKYLAPAAGLAMIFYPGKFSTKNYLKLNKNDELEINYEDFTLCEKNEAILMKAFRTMGYFCLKALNQYPKSGNSLHHAGTIPMKSRPQKYQTDADGKLFGSNHVYVTDGACFSDLPAKNLTFTIMANALRIATKIGNI